MATQEFTTEELESEEWRPVVGYETRYSISSFGRVRSKHNPHLPRRGVALLSPQIKKRGYLRVGLSSGARHNRKDFAIHALVAMAFIGPRPPSRREINHKDGNKLNNHWTNLEYVTRSENMRHAYALGLLNGHTNFGPRRRQSFLDPSRIY